MVTARRRAPRQAAETPRSATERPRPSRCGRVAERYRSLVRAAGHRSWFATLGRAFVPLDRFVYRVSGGTWTILGADVLPELLLTTSGRRSGQDRTVALLYARHKDDYVVVVELGTTASSVVVGESAR